MENHWKQIKVRRALNCSVSNKEKLEPTVICLQNRIWHDLVGLKPGMTIHMTEAY